MTSEVTPETAPLVASGLAITRGHQLVLRSATFTLEKGIFAALVGPSGSGKTSLLRVLALLDKPDGGKMYLWGDEYDGAGRNGAANHPHIYPRLTYVPQTLGLWPHLTIRDNLLFATSRTTRVNEELQTLCSKLDITQVIDRKPANASQGQRQRAALVRALLLNPEVLLLDEMTAALDGQLASTVWDLLHSFSDGGGVILASTHDLRLAAKCRRIYQIADYGITREVRGDY